MTLPAEVIQTDRKLQRSADQLMELRWHWTLDETNTDRVGFSAYARGVGVTEGAIRRDARAWAGWLQAEDSYSGVRIGSPQTPEDFRQLHTLSEERQEAAKAVAKATGAPVGQVAKKRKDEIDAVVNTARVRAVERGTTVEHEIGRAADWREKARKAAHRETDERRKAQTMRYVQFEGLIGKAMASLRTILIDSEGVDLDDELRELLTHSLGNLRALLNLIDLRITGETQVDWDAELEKLGK